MKRDTKKNKKKLSTSAHKHNNVIIPIWIFTFLFICILILDLTVIKSLDISGVVTELHGIVIELLLIAIIGSFWINAKEKKKWERVKPIFYSRILSSCNLVCEAILDEEGPEKYEDRFGVEFGEIFTETSFHFDRLYEEFLDPNYRPFNEFEDYKLVKATLIEEDSLPISFIKLKNAYENLNSILDTISAFDNRHIEDYLIVEIYELINFLSPILNKIELIINQPETVKTESEEYYKEKIKYSSWIMDLRETFPTIFELAVKIGGGIYIHGAKQKTKAHRDNIFKKNISKIAKDYKELTGKEMPIINETLKTLGLKDD